MYKARHGTDFQAFLRTGTVRSGTDLVGERTGTDWHGTDLFRHGYPGTDLFPARPGTGKPARIFSAARHGTYIRARMLFRHGMARHGTVHACNHEAQGRQLRQNTHEVLVFGMFCILGSR